MKTLFYFCCSVLMLTAFLIVTKSHRVYSLNLPQAKTVREKSPVPDPPKMPNVILYKEGLKGDEIEIEKPHQQEVKYF